MHNIIIMKFSIAVPMTAVVSAMLLTISTSSNAYDMDAAAAIYEEEIHQEQAQEVYQQATPQGHSREYYQQKWLENQGMAQPAMQQPQHQPQRQTQPAPESDDLFMAAVNGNNGQIGRLISQGLNINVANEERETALHMAVARGHYSTVIYLINNGANVNARTVKNWIPLHHAVRFRHANIVNYLLQRGSSADARTSDGLSSIDMARNANDNRLLSILGAH